MTGNNIDNTVQLYSQLSRFKYVQKKKCFIDNFDMAIHQTICWPSLLEISYAPDRGLKVVREGFAGNIVYLEKFRYLVKSHRSVQHFSGGLNQDIIVPGILHLLLKRS